MTRRGSVTDLFFDFSMSPLPDHSSCKCEPDLERKTCRARVIGVANGEQGQTVKFLSTDGSTIVCHTFPHRTIGQFDIDISALTMFELTIDGSGVLSKLKRLPEFD